jgi:catechol 2,3-dioxygenase-like lactoylglutathione lyase family enzyme
MNRPGTAVFIGLNHHEAAAAERFAETRTGLDHVGLHVSERADLDRWVAHLDAQGVPHGGVTEVNEPFPYAVVVFRDPDNIQLEVVWT